MLLKVLILRSRNGNDIILTKVCIEIFNWKKLSLKFLSAVILFLFTFHITVLVALHMTYVALYY